MWEVVEHQGRQKNIPPNFSRKELVAVPISRDRECINAVLWAAKHILTKDKTLLLLHVVTGSLRSLVSLYNAHPEPEVYDQPYKDLFTMYRHYCERNKIEFIQIVIQESDVAKGIIEFIEKDCTIRHLVVRASPRPILKRMMRGVRKFSSVVERLMEDAPVFCNLHVISDKLRCIMSRSDILFRLSPRHYLKQDQPILDDSYESSRYFVVTYVPRLPAFQTEELRRLALVVSRYIMSGNPQVKWESIKGVGNNAKQLLREEIVLPLKYSTYFNGLVEPCKGILLFGPPGTGKTMLANAVATESDATFFNIASSSLVDRWGSPHCDESIRVLFEIAKHRAPSIIFLDEIDKIDYHYSSSDDEDFQVISRRRVKTELLIQMDGLKRMQDEGVFVLAATNQPWNLDGEMLRRFDKRIEVPLPKAELRKAMFEELLPSINNGGVKLPYNLLVDKTEGYSASDVRLLCKEASMQPIRRLMPTLDQLHDDEQELPMVGPVGHEDIDVALRNTKPSTHLQYQSWHEDFNANYGTKIHQQTDRESPTTREDS